MNQKLQFALASAASLFVLHAAIAQDGAAKQDSPVVAATVNGTPISESKVAFMVKQNLQQGQPESPELRKEVIDHLALQYLVSKEALQKGLDKKPEVQEQLELAKQSILASAYVQDYLANNTVSDAQVKAEYDKAVGQFEGKEYRARHILVASEKEATALIAKLTKNPKSFPALAKEKSADPGSKEQGGELGWFDPQQMVPEFSEALGQLSVGQITQKPVKTQFGFHVIELEETRAKTPPPFDAMKPVLQQRVLQQSLQKLLDEMKAAAKIEVVQSAPAAKP